MTETRRPGRPATGKTPTLNVRVPKDVQDAARAKAEQLGLPFAAEVTRLLAEYHDEMDRSVGARVRDFLRVASLPPHKLHADQFEEAEAVAAGAMIGARMAGKDIPPWSEDAVESFRAAVAEAFDAGFRAGQEATR